MKQPQRELPRAASNTARPNAVEDERLLLGAKSRGEQSTADCVRGVGKVGGVQSIAYRTKYGNQYQNAEGGMTKSEAVYALHIYF